MKKIILWLVAVAILTTSIVSIISPNKKTKTEKKATVATQSPISNEVSSIPLSERPLSKIDFDYLFNVQDKDVLYEQSSYVVKGKFIKAGEVDVEEVLGILKKKYTLEVDEVFKGELSKNEEIDVYVIGGQLTVKDYKNLIEKNNLQKKGEKNFNHYPKSDNDYYYENYGINPDVNNGKEVLLYLEYNTEKKAYIINAFDNGYKNVDNDIVRSIDQNKTPDFNISEVVINKNK